MAERQPIPVPWKQRWRRIRDRFLPVATFVVAVALMGWLWERHAAVPNAVGEVHAIRMDVISGADGVLMPLADRRWMPFDPVRSGQIVARLNDRPTLAALETLRKELARLEAELDATAQALALEYADRRREHLTELARLTWRAEQLRLQELDRKALLEADRVQLQRREEYLAALNRLGAGATTEIELIDARLRRDVLSEQIKGHAEALKKLAEQKAEEQKRLDGFPAAARAEMAKRLAPFHAAVAVQHSLIEELNLQVKALAIRSPISGTIAAIYRWPGQAVRAGDAVLTVAAESSPYILSYVRQDQRLRPTVGMKVQVRARAANAELAWAVVNHIGAQFEPVPPQQLRDPRVPEWGLPVRINLPGELQLRPGELVDITFRPDVRSNSG